MGWRSHFSRHHIPAAGSTAALSPFWSPDSPYMRLKMLESHIGVDALSNDLHWLTTTVE